MMASKHLLMFFTGDFRGLVTWGKCVIFFVAGQLYGEFADHFKLSECKLAIIHCAGHADPILVHSLWQEIMEKGKSAQADGCFEKFLKKNNIKLLMMMMIIIITIIISIGVIL